MRIALGVRDGDEIAYVIKGNLVTLRKKPGEAPADDPFRAFEKWDSEADCRAFAKL